MYAALEKVIWPEAERVVTPDTAPRVVTSNAVESTANVSPLSPSVTIPLAVNVCPFATVSPPLAEIRPDVDSVPVIAVLSERAIEPEPESITMFPVVEPPMLRVFILRDWRVAVEPVRDIPLPFVVAEIVAVGAPSLIPVTANSAEEVAVEPKRKSRVEARFG